MTQREELVELLNCYFTIGDSYAYNLTRVKEAFAIGTVELDDFVEFDEEITADIADFLLENGVIVPPCKVKDDFYFIGQYAKNGKLTNDYQVCEAQVSSIEYDGDLAIYDFNGLDYCLEDIFLTKEEAEKALAEKENKNEEL